MTRPNKPDKPGAVTHACNLMHFSGTDDANAITDDDSNTAVKSDHIRGVGSTIG